ncbi:MAG: D-alanine--D-alanine ligase [Candidatus Omnitrophica bacterium]|nr:D-alanine--D-alanine ligase [Candidatus Omnitrophota bacterium]
MEINRITKEPKNQRTDFGRIGVLMGGPSSEREISLKSGHAVEEALKGLGLDVTGIDIKSEDPESNKRLLRDHGINCAFLALHGRFGEDGAIQEILESLGLPYTGSGVKASRLAMDKIASLEIFRRAGLDVPRFEVVEKNKRPGFNSGLRLPLVIKPATHGSSIGLSIVEKREDLPQALDEAFIYDGRAVVQEYISGRELTVGILEEKALPVIEIIPKTGFFDFQAKYQAGMTEYVVPAKLSDKDAERAQEAALHAHKLLGCFGCSRVDIILSGDSVPYILEINTIPGMTSTSLLPKAAKVTGIDFGGLCLRLLAIAYEKKKAGVSG